MVILEAVDEDHIARPFAKPEDGQVPTADLMTLHGWRAPSHSQQDRSADGSLSERIATGAIRHLTEMRHTRRLEVPVQHRRVEV